MGFLEIVVIAMIYVFANTFVRNVNLFSPQTPFKSNEPKRNIVTISVIFRHGDRRPDFLWPGFPNPNSVFYPEGPGSLTNAGKLRQYNVGKALRQRYDAFLGDIVESETVFCVSSEYARSRRSLLYLLAGLYPPKGVQIWNDDLQWQAILCDYLPLSQDKIFFGALSGEATLLLDEYQSTPEYRKKMHGYQSVLETIHNNTGLKYGNLISCAHVACTLNSLKEMGIPLPDWASNIHPSPLDEFMVDFYKFYTFNDTMTSFTAGFLMKDILASMKDRISGKLAGRKISLYSGHDINIAGMLRLLKVYDNKSPQYGSYIIFELLLIEQTHGIRVLIQNYEKSDPIPLILPGCKEICPLDQFTKLVQSRLPIRDTLSMPVKKP